MSWLRRGRLGLLALGLAGAVAACAPRAAPQLAVPIGTPVKVWASSSDQSRRLAEGPALVMAPAGLPQAGDLVLDPADRRQEIVGFGAAMTDASAHLFQNVLTRPERDQLFRELFGPEALHFSLVRVPIGASDFSSQHYSLDDVPAGQADPDLKRFSMARVEAEQIPALQAARAINPRLTLMASPWSAPGWMKSTGSLIKGTLKPEYHGAFARYFVRYLDAMQAAGLPVRYITLQNEPAFEPADYPGMRLSAAQRARIIGQHLGPALAARQQKVGILDWDHNWDMPEEPLAVLSDPVAAPHVAGVAWHCYAGDPRVMGEVKAAYPDKDLFFTECSGGDWSPNWGETLGWMTDNLVIAPIRAGGKGVLLWNLALDEKAGPHLGGCGNCRGVVTIDSRTRAVTRNVEYYVLGHVSRFVHPGARAIGSSGGTAGINHAAFRNADGSLVLLARNTTATPLTLAVRIGSSRFAATMPGGEVMTFVWMPPSDAP